MSLRFVVFVQTFCRDIKGYQYLLFHTLEFRLHVDFCVVY